MTVHTCASDHAGILADDCERCTEHAKTPMLLDLDRQKLAALWSKMQAVEYGEASGGYETANEAAAGRQLYMLSIWLQRNLSYSVDQVSIVLAANAAMSPL